MRTGGSGMPMILRTLPMICRSLPMILTSTLPMILRRLPMFRVDTCILAMATKTVGIVGMPRDNAAYAAGAEIESSLPFPAAAGVQRIALLLQLWAFLAI